MAIIKDYIIANESNFLLDGDWHTSHKALLEGAMAWTEFRPQRAKLSEFLESLLFATTNDVHADGEVMTLLTKRFKFILHPTIAEWGYILGKGILMFRPIIRIRTSNFQFFFANPDFKLSEEEWVAFVRRCEKEMR
jgi:hypothetical protein